MNGLEFIISFLYFVLFAIISGVLLFMFYTFFDKKMFDKEFNKNYEESKKELEKIKNDGNFWE